MDRLYAVCREKGGVKEWLYFLDGPGPTFMEDFHGDFLFCSASSESMQEDADTHGGTVVAFVPESEIEVLTRAIDIAGSDIGGVFRSTPEYIALARKELEDRHGS